MMMSTMIALVASGWNEPPCTHQDKADNSRVRCGCRHPATCITSIIKVGTSRPQDTTANHKSGAAAATAAADATPASHASLSCNHHVIKTHLPPSCLVQDAERDSACWLWVGFGQIERAGQDANPSSMQVCLNFFHGERDNWSSVGVWLR